MDPRTVRAALAARRRADKARALADEAETEARAAEAAAGINPRALAIARRLAAKSAAPALEAILAAGLTVDVAAALCGTTADSLRKAWARGKQLQPAPRKWRQALARFGVPADFWPDKS